MTQFTWLPFFEEMLSVVCKEYDANSLAKIYNKIRGNNKKDEIIDPLTFIGYFNRSTTDKTRIEHCKQAKEKLNLKSDLPEDFEGIPVLNNTNAEFFSRDNLENDIKTQWEFANKLNQGNIDDSSFQNSLNVKNVKPAKLTILMYICKPNDYLPLDKQTKAYLLTKNINCKVSDWNSYNQVIENVKRLNLPFYKVSYEAYGAITHQTSLNYWLIAPEENATQWNNWQKEEIISVGWDEIGNYKDYGDKKEITKALKAEGRHNPIQTTSMIYSFANEIQIGDIVFAKTGTKKLLGYGEVLSDYKYEPDKQEHKHTRKVKWFKTGEWKLPDDIKLHQKTLTEITQYPEYLEKIKQIIGFDDDVTKPGLYSLKDALEDLFYEENEFTEIVDVLSFKKNIILQGAPGVGKTFIAKRLAYCLMGEKADNRVEMIQFHQSYSYEDFIQGYRPDENCGFVRKNGAFYEFCQKAKKDTANKYVFIIDEINRGNLSKIFGELMMLIEPDKRGEDFSLPLTYAKSGEDKFYIPENVYLIGTMNTADRSLAMVDYALRRRFAFITLEPKFGDKFKDFLRYKNVAPELIEKIVVGMNGLNEKIKADDKNLGKGYQIGHSFFCGNADNNAMDEHWYKWVIQYEIKPLLEEYWFDDENKVQTQINELLG